MTFYTHSNSDSPLLTAAKHAACYAEPCRDEMLKRELKARGLNPDAIWKTAKTAMRHAVYANAVDNSREIYK